jgi:exopolyphosphatase/guanosine-5'-triphosphate,3'-diphosphate pyrophosphatase
MSTGRDPLPSPGRTIAAVDLGSNSFHMIVARLEGGQLVVLDRLREMVRLGAGLEPGGALSDAAVGRALGCLRRFSERLGDMNADSVRAVGTNTLRRARDRGVFLERAEAALGHPIEVISGVEEARLVYLGAAHSLPMEPGNRLVVDIGGGSTELIVGGDYQPRLLESLYMGCVSISREFFTGGRVTAGRFRKARLAARQELEPMTTRFRDDGWSRAFGTSGTIRSTARQLAGEGNPSGIITRDGLEALVARLIECRDLGRHRPPGLSEQRAPVYPGGLAILAEVFDALGIESMMAADGALREGLLFDLMGRMTDRDARERTVDSMARRFHVDPAQGARVAGTAQGLLGQLRDSWDLGGEMPARLIGWAARLHEIGMDIAHARHHCHAAYLLQNADMAGFSTGEQRLIAALVGNHRRRIRSEYLAGLPAGWASRIRRLIVILRLAVLLNRARSDEALPVIRVKPREDGLKLAFPEDWLEAHPLTRADLSQEAAYLQTLGIKLRCR